MDNYASFIEPAISILTKNHKPFLYEVGQKIRVSKKVIMDGQTPDYWGGAICQILRRSRTGIISDKHLYRVRILHKDKTCEFFEEELDRRFIRKNLDKR